MSACRARKFEAAVLRVLFVIVLLLATAPKLPAAAAQIEPDGFWGRVALCLTDASTASEHHGAAVHSGACCGCLAGCGGALDAPPLAGWTPSPPPAAVPWRVGPALAPHLPTRASVRPEPRAPPVLS